MLPKKVLMLVRWKTFVILRYIVALCDVNVNVLRHLIIQRKLYIVDVLCSLVVSNAIKMYTYPSILLATIACKDIIQPHVKMQVHLFFFACLHYIFSLRGGLSFPPLKRSDTQYVQMSIVHVNVLT